MFFEKFEFLCKQKGISPSKASKEIGFSKGSVSRWRKSYMQGVNLKPGIGTAQLIAQYFGVSLDYLLGSEMVNPLQELLNTRKPQHVLRDRTPIALAQNPVLTDRELLLVDAYRCHPELQALIDQALGIADPIEEEDEKA